MKRIHNPHLPSSASHLSLLLLTFHLSILIFLFVPPAYSQQRWQRTYGRYLTDVGSSVQQTADGGYIVAGWTFSFGNWSQVYLIKTNGYGDTLWTKTYGGTDDDLGFSVQQTVDGDYIVAGWTLSLGNNVQVSLIKTNASGDTLWTKTYGGSNEDYGCSIQQSSDSGYIIAGYTSSFGNDWQVYLIKINASGDTIWTRTYGGTNADRGQSVQQTADEGYIVAGWTLSFGNGKQVYLIKTNGSGDTLWTKNYGGTNDDLGCSVRQTLDGGYIIAGGSYSFGNSEQVYLIKTNASGDTLWTRTYGGADYDQGNSVQQTSDGGFVIAGYTSSYGTGDMDVYLIKTNISGDTLWTKTYDVGAYNAGGNSVQQTTDGGYIIAGYAYPIGSTYCDVYLIKTDANGNVGVEENTGVRDQGLGVRITATPNPFKSFASVPGHEEERFSLYDISGRKVGTYQGDRIGEGLSAGVYFVRPEGDGRSLARVVKIR